ncbi:MAG: DUF340 domain-containing protein [Desulfosporosinus sp.]|nr:DUF340 domain-containing protein [Desulfosporosinus sp.]
MSKPLVNTIKENLFSFAVVSVGIFISNFIINFKAGNNLSPLECIPTILLLAAVSLIGVILKEVIKLKIPVIVYVSLLATILSLPYFSWHEPLLALLGKVSFTAFLTPILAYTGISIGKDVGGFIKAGPKLILVSILVFIGTYLGSAVIGQVGLKITGII